MSIYHLPQELELRILQYSDAKTTCSMAQVNMRWRKLSMENSLWKGRCAKRFGNANLTNGAYKKLQLRYGSYLTCWKDWYAFRSQFRREVAGTIDIEGMGHSFGASFLGYQYRSGRIVNKSLIIDFVCRSQPEQYSQYVDRRPVKIHFDEYATIIEGTVWKPKTWKKPKLVGKFEIPLLAIKSSSHSTWIDLESETDFEFISPPSSPEIRLEDDAPRGRKPDKSASLSRSPSPKRKSQVRKARRSSGSSSDGDVKHSGEITQSIGPNGVNDITKAGKRRVLLQFNMTPVNYTVNDFNLIASISRGTTNTPHELLLVREKDSGKLYFMKIISTRADAAIEETRLKDLISYSVAPRWNFPSHPFLVDLFTTFQTDCKLYLLMEWVGGGELFSILRRTENGRFDEKTALFYGAEILLGIEHLHQNKIVYRDLKPENILLSEDGHCKLTQRTPPECLWDDGRRDVAVLGNGLPEYLAPELLRGQPATPKSDYWSFGTILFEMVVGHPPFFHHNVQILQQRIMFGELSIPSYLSTDTQALLAGLLTRDVKKRFGKKQVLQHPFFKELDTQRLLKKEMKAPLKPFRRTDLDFGVKKTASGRFVPVERRRTNSF